MRNVVQLSLVTSDILPRFSPKIVNFFPDVPSVVVVVVAHFPGREGGVLNKVLSKEAPPRGPNPYPFIYHFRQKRYPFCIPSIDKLYSLRK